MINCSKQITNPVKIYNLFKIDYEQWRAVFVTFNFFSILKPYVYEINYKVYVLPSEVMSDVRFINLNNYVSNYIHGDIFVLYM